MIDPRDHEAISPDLSGYALNALDDDARDLVERHVADCEDCTSELEELTEGAATLSFAVPSVMVPPGLLDRINSVLDGEFAHQAPQTVVERPRSTSNVTNVPWWGNPRLAWGVSAGLAAAFVAIVAVGAVTGMRLDDRVDELSAQVALQDGSIDAVAASMTTMERDAERAFAGAQQVSILQDATDTLEQQVKDLRWLQYVTSAGTWTTPSFFTGGLQPQAPQGMLITHSSGEEALLMVNGLAPALSGSVYQVWLTYEGLVVPGSTFTVDDNGYAVVKLDLSGDATEYIGASVTVEPVGGSAVPSEFVVLVGTSQ